MALRLTSPCLASGSRDRPWFGTADAESTLGVGWDQHSPL